MAKQIAKIGDVFKVPLEDGSFVSGQIVEIQKEVLNSITCAFFDSRTDTLPGTDLEKHKLISVQFVTKDLFNSGKWERIENNKVTLSTKLLPYRETKKKGWVGAKVIGSGIIEMFLNAFYGLRPWDEMKDSEYYQKLLLPGVERAVSA